jgi:hypothetical protein
MMKSVIGFLFLAVVGVALFALILLVLIILVIVLFKELFKTAPWVR